MSRWRLCEQGTLARDRKPRRQSELPIDDGRNRADPIVPFAFNATTLRWERLAPGPDSAAAWPEQRLTQQADLLDLPSRRERALRLQVGQLVAAQVVEDEGMLRIPRGAGAHHTYSAALKRVMQKGRVVMSLAELEATVAWLERNRLSDHLHLLESNAKYAWTARQRRLDLGSGKRLRERATKPSAAASGP